MKRVAYVLTVLGILCVAAGQAQAHDFYHHGHHGGYYSETVVVRPPIFVAPRFVVPVLPPPSVVYPPAVYAAVHPYRCYAPAPRVGFYYQGRGLSFGVGW